MIISKRTKIYYLIPNELPKNAYILSYIFLYAETSSGITHKRKRGRPPGSRTKSRGVFSLSDIHYT